MTGTSETAYWERDGQYVSMTASEDITLGNVVSVGSTDGYVDIADTGDYNVLGVAIAGYRTSRTATDNVIDSGNQVTVATRGIVNITCTGTVTTGDLVQSETGGAIKTVTVSETGGGLEMMQVIGMALTTATTGTVKVKLFRG